MRWDGCIWLRLPDSLRGWPIATVDRSEVCNYNIASYQTLNMRSARKIPNFWQSIWRPPKKSASLPRAKSQEARATNRSRQVMDPHPSLMRRQAKWTTLDTVFSIYHNSALPKHLPYTQNAVRFCSPKRHKSSIISVSIHLCGLRAIGAILFSSGDDLGARIRGIARWDRIRLRLKQLSRSPWVTFTDLISVFSVTSGL